MVRTPGRTPSKHVPYRGGDSTRGKKTGKTIPSAPRTSDGYEHFPDLIAHSDNYTPPQRGSNLKRKKPVVEEHDDEGSDEGEMSMELDDSPVQQASTSRAKPRALARAVSPSFDDIPTPKRRKSIARMSAKELLENNEEDEEDEEQEQEQGMGYGGTEDYDDDEPVETPKYRKGKGKAPLTPVMEIDEEQEEEEEQETPPPKKKAKRSPAKPKSRRREPQPESDDPPPGVRRSKRKPCRPIEYWRGEHVVYAPRDANHPRQVPQIQEVIRIPKEPPKPLSRRKGSSRARSQTKVVEREVIIEVDKGNPEAGWDDNTLTEAMVHDFVTGEQTKRRVAFTSKMFNPQQARVTGPEDAWSFEKIFGDEEFMAAGQLTIPPKKRKPSKAAKDNTYIFYIVQGALNVTVGTQSLVLSQGGMFMVPRGNTYTIENISDREAKLFFTQARKVADPTEEDEDESDEDEQTLVQR
ncbi:CENP-C-C domain-containing protein [Mycena chlorophos]|uniref:CENP-C homolog n=1 Tax=Mycena chlorophos TaxID=658473 RepID=A0A8H6T5D2_MYCCL|nr:CENP-C-C domain-containing protein [Mycena chlorophos]